MLTTLRDALSRHIHSTLLGWHPRAMLDLHDGRMKLRCPDCRWTSPGIRTGKTPPPIAFPDGGRANRVGFDRAL